MSLSFPPSAINGQVYQGWVFDGEKWNPNWASLFVTSVNNKSGALMPADVVGSGNRVLINRQTITAAVAEVDFQNMLTSTYDDYELVVMGAKPTAETSAVLRFSTDGSTWITTTTYYNTYIYISSLSPTLIGGGYSAVSLVNLPGNCGITYGNYVRLRFNRAIAGVVTWDAVQLAYGATAIIAGTNTGVLAVANPVVGVQFLMNSQQVASGVFSLYGIVK